MIEFRTEFCKDWSRRKKTYKKKQIGLFCANKPSEVYPNTLPLYLTPYISEINRDWLPLSVADERLQTSWGCEKQTKSTMRNETGVLSTTIPSLLVMEAKK
jgi:hypothetical protein